MIRIHLEGADLGRVRFLDVPAPLLEGAMMLFELYNARGLMQAAGRPGDWRDRVRRSFPSAARPLGDLFSQRRAVCFLGALAPETGAGLDVVRSQPTAYLDRELRTVWPGFPDRAPGWLRPLARGDVDARHVLHQALQEFHSSCVAPLWSYANTCFEADVSQRIAMARRGGVAAMLDTLSDEMRVNGSVLELPSPLDVDVRPGGRGLLLAPSAFWTGAPQLTSDQQDLAQPVLVYSAGADPGSMPETGGTGDALAALLGATRARVLRALRVSRTTGGLATYLGISASSSSQHTAALRDAGLITSRRDGQRVCHRVTELGVSLIRGAHR